ncbi:hypothetical protein PYCC9005_004773 [Savitreella phatthalungensis]
MPWSPLSLMLSAFLPLAALLATPLAAAQDVITDPCTLVSADFSIANVTTVARARACVRTVPFNLTRATLTRQLAENLGAFESLKEYAIHSSNPEVNSVNVDIDLEIKQIHEKAISGHYKTDIDFNTDIHVAFGKFFNGHTIFLPDCISAFSYVLGLPLVSLAESENSTEPAEIRVLPELKTYLADAAFDLEHAYLRLGIDLLRYAGRRVVAIQGRPAIDYLLALANDPGVGLLSYQSPDARFNQLLVNYAYSPARLSYGRFAVRRLLPNHTESHIKLEFDDNSHVDLPFLAANVERLRFNDTASFFDENCVVHKKKQPSSATPGHNATTTTTTTSTVSPRNPRFWMQSAKISSKFEDKLVDSSKQAEGWPRGKDLLQINSTLLLSVGDSMYFWQKQDDPAIGIIQVASFEDSVQSDLNATEYVANFAHAMRKGLGLFRELGVQKIVIDFTGNGGGFIGLGFVFLLHLFPNDFPGFAQDNRVPPFLKDTVLPQVLQQKFYDSSWYYMNWTTPDRQAEPDMSFQLNVSISRLTNGLMSPMSAPYYANLTDFEDEMMPSSSAGDYLFRDTAPYSPTDYVLVSNAICASTCAQVANTLLFFHNISSVAFGGRPTPLARTQITGGVKGSQVFDLDSFIAELGQLGPHPFHRVIPGTFSINLRNALAVGQNKHFHINDYADSKPSHVFQYTNHTYLSPEAQWHKAVAAIWQPHEIDRSKAKRYSGEALKFDVQQPSIHVRS